MNSAPPFKLTWPPLGQSGQVVTMVWHPVNCRLVTLSRDSV